MSDLVRDNLIRIHEQAVKSLKRANESVRETESLLGDLLAHRNEVEREVSEHRVFLDQNFPDWRTQGEALWEGIPEEIRNLLRQNNVSATEAQEWWVAPHQSSTARRTRTPEKEWASFRYATVKRWARDLIDPDEPDDDD